MTCLLSARAPQMFDPGQPSLSNHPRTIFLSFNGQEAAIAWRRYVWSVIIHIDDVCEAWKVANEAPISETYHI